MNSDNNTSTVSTINGIDTGALQGAIDAIKQDSAAGQTRWSVRSEWMGGTRTDHHVDSFEIGGETVVRPFSIRIDEPLQLCGTNEYANPQEYLLAALNGCMMVGYSAVAALMGIELDSLTVEIEGDIDLRGFLAIDPAVSNGYEGLQQIVRISSANASDEQIRELHDAVLATSPNLFNVTRAIPTNSRLVIQ